MTRCDMVGMALHRGAGFRRVGGTPSPADALGLVAVADAPRWRGPDGRSRVWRCWVALYLVKVACRHQGTSSDAWIDPPQGRVVYPVLFFICGACCCYRLLLLRRVPPHRRDQRELTVTRQLPDDLCVSRDDRDFVHLHQPPGYTWIIVRTPSLASPHTGQAPLARGWPSESRTVADRPMLAGSSFADGRSSPDLQQCSTIQHVNELVASPIFTRQ